MELGNGNGFGARMIVQSGALTTRLVLVDVGARDGIHPRWKPLHPVLDVYGYDAAVPVPSDNPRHRYFKIALGDHDGVARFEVPTNGYEARVTPDGSTSVRMAKLDTLFADQKLPAADFIKIDCEGYEPQILDGASSYFEASCLLGADIETTFNTSPTLPDSHFYAVFKPLNLAGLFVADFAFASAAGVSQLAWPGTCNALFARKFYDTDSPTCDNVLKQIAIYDIYGLYTPAVEMARRFRPVIADRIDVDALCDAIKPRLVEATAKSISVFERALPHLGLGIWSGVRRRLGLY